MSLVNGLALLLALALGVFLAFALLHPERIS